VGIDFAEATRDRYNTTLNHIKDFIKFNYNKNDIYLMEMPYEFITDLEHYLKTKTNFCNHNSTQKYIRNFRKIINICVLNGWLPKDPFAKYKSRLDPAKKIFLTEKELEALENKRIEIPRLELIRDIFVFCCYTGLAYVDVAKLNEENVKEVEGKKVVKSSLLGNRTKSGTEFYIPLLPPALNIINKYKNHPKRILKKTLLPILSNQKINAYLKEIADICGINKNLTSYVARKTFVTTICVKNHITPTSLLHMLGQKDFRTTIKYYVAFEKDNVDEEMQQLADKKIRQNPVNFNLN
jgi:site-specific recombinase XerD